jgi:hypothetical protein
VNAQAETARCTGHCCQAFALGDGVSPVELGQKVREGALSPLMKRWVTTALVYLGAYHHNPVSGRTGNGRLRYWYTCTKLSDAGSCMDYVNRPWTCRDYPHGRECIYEDCTRKTA